MVRSGLTQLVLIPPRAACKAPTSAEDGSWRLLQGASHIHRSAFRKIGRGDAICCNPTIYKEAQETVIATSWKLAFCGRMPMFRVVPKYRISIFASRNFNRCYSHDLERRPRNVRARSCILAASSS